METCGTFAAACMASFDSLGVDTVTMSERLSRGPKAAAKTARPGPKVTPALNFFAVASRLIPALPAAGKDPSSV